ncbi:MAG: FG-GAP repeat domain-containing protein [Polyangiaceae bacterium]
MVRVENDSAPWQIPELGWVTSLGTAPRSFGTPVAGPPPPVDVGKDTTWLFADDVNGDHLLDVIDVVRSGNPKIFFVVYLGDGLGGFEQLPEQQPIVQYNWTALYADFDGDGHKDIALPLNTVPNWVVVSFGDWMGGFGSAATTTTSLAWFAAGDFNRDGKTDLVATDSSCRVNVMLSAGRTFSSPQVLRTGATSCGAASLATADINGDGTTDVVLFGPSTNGQVIQAFVMNVLQ